MFALMTVVAMAHGSASARPKRPELPLPTSAPALDQPLNLEDLLNIDELLNGELPVSTDLDETVGDVTDTVSGVLGGSNTGPGAPDDGNAKRAPTSELPVSVPRTGSWATEPMPVPTGLVGPTRVSSNKVPSVSYGAAVGDGFARAARRAAELAGPIAAPMILALFAVGLLVVAARGPGRLVKVEEERKAFRDQRTFRL